MYGRWLEPHVKPAPEFLMCSLQSCFCTHDAISVPQRECVNVKNDHLNNHNIFIQWQNKHFVQEAIIFRAHLFPQLISCVTFFSCGWCAFLTYLVVVEHEAPARLWLVTTFWFRINMSVNCCVCDVDQVHEKEKTEYWLWYTCRIELKP